MEEAQFSEDLFSTQDEATFQNADSVPEVVPEKSVEKDLIPSSSENASSSVAQEECASIEKDTPDLVFSEDIEFEKYCEETIDTADKSDVVAALDDPVELNENAENITGTEGSNEAIESNVHQPKIDNASGSKAPEERLAVFPFARIKQIMKLDPDVGIVSAEAIFVVTKAAELFLQTLAKDTSTHTLASKKKTMSKRDVDSAIDNVDALMFLEGMMNV